MPKDFSSLGDIIKRDPQLGGLRRILKEADVVADFERIFPDLIKIAVPVKVERQILFLRVDNAAWRSELKFKEMVIVKKINEFYGEDRIKIVKFI